MTFEDSQSHIDVAFTRGDSRGPVCQRFDCDALDPAFAPGTGTPAWDARSSGHAAAILRLTAGINLPGGDAVGVWSPFDATEATAIAGAHAAVEIACLWTVANR